MTPTSCRLARRAALALSVAVFLLLGCGKRARPEITIAAASSLRAALPELVVAFEAARAELRIVVTYGSSGELRQQLEAGAPLDGALFASPDPADALIDEGLADLASRRVFASNRLVLIGPKGGPKVTFDSLDSLPPDAKIALGDPRHVPAGRYARDFLQKLGKWDAIRDRVVLAGDVAAALAYARRGEIAAAVVYATDILGIDDVVLLDEARGAAAPRIEYVLVAASGRRVNAEARAFLDLVTGPEGREILRRHGFGAP